MTKKPIPSDLQFAASFTSENFDKWEAGETLGKLRRFLEVVQEEMCSFDEDELVIDHWDNLCDAADYLTFWGDPKERDTDEDELTFSYRLVNVEEDLMHVEDLIEVLGESFKISDLPMPEYGKKQPEPA